MATLCLVILFAFIALAGGFACGVWWYGAGAAPVAAPNRQVDPQQVPPEPVVEAERTAEWAVMAFQRIQDVASALTGDAGSHTSKVDAITAELQSIATGQSDVSSDAVLHALHQIADASAALKQRLSMAEKQLESQASELHSFETEARTDSLTGLANRRAFDDEMKRQYEIWQRQNIPFTLLIFDIDKFKSFNDSHGHQAGDEVLRNVGKLLVHTARQMDLPCRYGGEEFAVVLPATDIREARVAAERFRKAIENASISFGGEQLKVTSSIGVAQISDADDPAHLIRRADEALYRSKEAGRNCAYWHDGHHCLPVTADVAEPQAAPVQKTLHETVQSFERLPSKKSFLDILQRRIAESQRFGIPLTVVQLKIDNYPAIKREYGKTFARELLDSVAQRAQLTLRQMDLLARYDDGEFLIMLVRCSKHEALDVAERLQAAIAEGYNPTGVARLPLSTHFGIAQLDSKETAEAMMSRAADSLESTVTKEYSLANSSPTAE
ncbi:MAG TPA: GGDEF domain-containing protein [Lacipirellulaceae bacterium]|jgi:diguanylate cyclase